MRAARTAVLAAKQALSAGTAAAESSALASAAGGAAALQLAPGGGAPRGFAAGGSPPEIKPNPLQQVVPPIIKGFGAAVAGVKGGVAAVGEGLTDGPATRSAIAYFADKFLLSGTFVPPSSLDLPKWAAWLAEHGYTDKAGWDTLMTGIKASASSLGPAEVEALVPALHSVGRYDRALFGELAEIVKARFTEFGTPGLCRLLPVFAAHDHFDAALWDDVADGVAYCNHYLAGNATPLADIAATYAAFAKFEVDRGDLFVVLARCIHEDRLKELDDEAFKAVAGSLLSSFKALSFYPDCTEALLVAGRLRPGAFGPAETATAAEVEAEMRSHTPSGALPWLDGGWKDPAHFHGGAFGDYQLWVTRDELIPEYYRPSDISPRPASMQTTPPSPPTAGNAPAAAASG